MRSLRPFLAERAIVRVVGVNIDCAEEFRERAGTRAVAELAEGFNDGGICGPSSSVDPQYIEKSFQMPARFRARIGRGENDVLVNMQWFLRFLSPR